MSILLIIVITVVWAIFGTGRIADLLLEGWFWIGYGLFYASLTLGFVWAFFSVYLIYQLDGLL